MNLTKQQIKEIRKLREEGLSTYELARKFKVAQSTICYHTDKTSKRRISYKSRKEYMKTYLKNRYKNDPIFREKQINRAKNYQKSKSLNL